MPAADRAEGHDQPEEDEDVHEPDDDEVGALLGRVGGGDEERNDDADCEDEKQRPDELRDVGGESSILHWK